MEEILSKWQGLDAKALQQIAEKQIINSFDKQQQELSPLAVSKEFTLTLVKLVKQHSQCSWDNLDSDLDRIVTLAHSTNLVDFKTLSDHFSSIDLPLKTLSIFCKHGFINLLTYFSRCVKRNPEATKQLTMELDKWIDDCLVSIDENLVLIIKDCFSYSLMPLNNIPKSVNSSLSQGKVVAQELVLRVLKRELSGENNIKILDNQALGLDSELSKGFHTFAMDFHVKSEDGDGVDLCPDWSAEMWNQKKKAKEIANANDEVLKNLLSPFSGQELAHYILEKSKTKGFDVNSLLNLVGSSLKSVQGFDKAFHELIVTDLVETIQRPSSSVFMSQDLESPSESFTRLLVLARHACLQGRQGSVFQDYSFWFGETFGYTNSPILANAKLVVNLFKLLTELVPFEPLWTINIHLNKQLQNVIPSAQKDLALDYNNITRTRKNDLMEEDRSKKPGKSVFSVEVSTEVARENSEADEDIVMALQQFQENGNSAIPKSVINMSMFRKAFFRGVFVPRLQHLQLTNPCDSKRSFIECLKRENMI